MLRSMRSISAGGLVLVAQLVSVSWLQAQTVPEIAAGSRIRVSTAPGFGGPSPLVATLVRSAGDTLTVTSPADGAALSIPHSAITRLEISGGKQSRALRGLAIGMAAGTAAGGLFWALSSSSCEGELCGTGFDDVFSAMAGVAAVTLGAVGGGTVGLIVGAARPAERWHPVPLATQTSIPGSGRHYAVGLSIGAGPGRR
jgi:hypothetical protein